ncbi:hypothetical protein ABW21_db0201989 [Orbilia brochopaga]|nr:hypothetical protein ABW21_db0201989 [Drechslerella brochopaga]
MPTTNSDLKTKRIKRIRSLAADRLSKDLGWTVTPANVTFIQAKSKGYNWYLDFTDSDDEADSDNLEFAIPNWATETQIWRWTVDQANLVTLWLRRGILRAESVGKQKPKQNIESKDGTTEVTDKRAVLEEVPITILTPEEKEIERKKWKKPRATIKGPASDFVSWNMGIADAATSKRMEAKYKGKVAVGQDIDSEDSDTSPAELPKDGDSVVTHDLDIPTIYAGMEYGVMVDSSSFSYGKLVTYDDEL